MAIAVVMSTVLFSRHVSDAFLAPALPALRSRRPTALPFFVTVYVLAGSSCRVLTVLPRDA